MDGTILYCGEIQSDRTKFFKTRIEFKSERRKTVNVSYAIDPKRAKR